jgi:hypothetical protein
MLSGASRNRPVIVGWSTALRGEVINESLGQLPKKLAAGRRVLARTESSRTQSGTKQAGSPHDHWAKLGQLRYTRSQCSFVVIALFSMKFYRAALEKKERLADRGRRACWQGLNHYAPNRARYRVDHGTITGRSWV